ncbi:hypothetical protein [Shewanella chilikensis]|uniref:hypothetical protein n=1 Tax=Shewanella chilikensis TaxID=558541 RepID=UPI003A974490
MTKTYRLFENKRLADLEGALGELIIDLAERVIPLQLAKGEPLQIIRFEIWEDTGRIIGFPAMEEMVERIDVAGAQVVCEELAERVELLDFEDISDEVYEKRIGEIVRDVAARVSLLADKMELFEFKVYNQDGSDITIT